MSIGFDGAAFGKEIVAVVKDYLERNLSPAYPRRAVGDPPPNPRSSGWNRGEDKAGNPPRGALKAANMINKREVIAASERAVLLFIRSFDRMPTRREVNIIVSAILRRLDEPDAPSQRLH